MLPPTLVLLLASLGAFAVGGNQLYFATTEEWHDLTSSIGTVLYLLRRPMGMNWERMAQSTMIWPLDSDEPSPVTVVFLLGFTCVTIWIMANLYRAVIIQEYMTVAQRYQHRPPGDLKLGRDGEPEPYPLCYPNVVWRHYRDQVKERRHRVRIDYWRKKQWHIDLETQKRKQREFMEEFKTRQEGGADESGTVKQKPVQLKSGNKKVDGLISASGRGVGKGLDSVKKVTSTACNGIADVSASATNELAVAHSITAAYA